MAEQEFMQEISEQFLICQICYETYKRPKTLSCLHTFCRSCLEKQNDSEIEKTTYRYVIYSRTISCPICRKRTDIPSGGINSLPDNFLVSNLTEVVNKSKPVTKEKDICQICITYLKTSKPASSKCLECAKTMCKDCMEVHRVTKVTQSHNVYDLQSQKDIACKSHCEEPIRFYCKPCESCICVVCTFQEHRNHEVCSLKEGIEEYADTLTEIVDSCNSKMEVLKTQLVVIDKYSANLNQVEEHINDVTTHFIDSIKARSTQVLEDVREYFGRDIVNGVARKDELEQLLQTLQHTSSLTEMMLKSKGIDLLLVKRNIRERMESLLQVTIPSLQKVSEKKDLKFIQGTFSLGYLDHGQEVHQNAAANFSNEARSSFQERCEYRRKTVASSQTDMSIVHDEYTTMDCNVVSCLEERAIQACIPVIGFDKETTAHVQTKDQAAATEPVETSHRNRHTSTADTVLKDERSQTDRVTFMDKITNTLEPLPHNKHSNTDRPLFYDKHTLTEDTVFHNKHTSTAIDTRNTESNTKITFSVDSGCNTVKPDVTSSSTGSDFLTFSDEDSTSTCDLELELLNYYISILSSIKSNQYITLNKTVPSIHETIEEVDLESGNYLRGKTSTMDFVLESLSAYAQSREIVMRQTVNTADKSTMVPRIYENMNGIEVEAADGCRKDAFTRMTEKESRSIQTMTTVMEHAESATSMDVQETTRIDCGISACVEMKDIGTESQSLDSYSSSTSTFDLAPSIDIGIGTNKEYVISGTTTEHFVKHKNKRVCCKIDFDQHSVSSSEEENVPNEINKRRSRVYSLDDPAIKEFTTTKATRRRKFSRNSDDIDKSVVCMNDSDISIEADNVYCSKNDNFQEFTFTCEIEEISSENSNSVIENLNLENNTVLHPEIYDSSCDGVSYSSSDSTSQSEADYDQTESEISDIKLISSRDVGVQYIADTFLLDIEGYDSRLSNICKHCKIEIEKNISQVTKNISDKTSGNSQIDLDKQGIHSMDKPFSSKSDIIDVTDIVDLTTDIRTENFKTEQSDGVNSKSGLTILTQEDSEGFKYIKDPRKSGIDKTNEAQLVDSSSDTDGITNIDVNVPFSLNTRDVSTLTLIEKSDMSSETEVMRYDYQQPHFASANTEILIDAYTQTELFSTKTTALLNVATQTYISQEKVNRECIQVLDKLPDECCESITISSDVKPQGQTLLLKEKEDLVPKTDTVNSSVGFINEEITEHLRIYDHATMKEPMPQQLKDLETANNEMVVYDQARSSELTQAEITCLNTDIKAESFHAWEDQKLSSICRISEVVGTNYEVAESMQGKCTRHLELSNMETSSKVICVDSCTSTSGDDALLGKFTSDTELIKWDAGDDDGMALVCDVSMQTEQHQYKNGNTCEKNVQVSSSQSETSTEVNSYKLGIMKDAICGNTVPLFTDTGVDCRIYEVTDAATITDSVKTKHATCGADRPHVMISRGTSTIRVLQKNFGVYVRPRIFTKATETNKCDMIDAATSPKLNEMMDKSSMCELEMSEASIWTKPKSLDIDSCILVDSKDECVGTNETNFPVQQKCTSNQMCGTDDCRDAFSADKAVDTRDLLLASPLNRQQLGYLASQGRRFSLPQSKPEVNNIASLTDINMLNMPMSVDVTRCKEKKSIGYGAPARHGYGIVIGFGHKPSLGTITGKRIVEEKPVIETEDKAISVGTSMWEENGRDGAAQECGQIPEASDNSTRTVGKKLTNYFSRLGLMKDTKPSSKQLARKKRPDMSALLSLDDDSPLNEVNLLPSDITLQIQKEKGDIKPRKKAKKQHKSKSSYTDSKSMESGIREDCSLSDMNFRPLEPIKHKIQKPSIFQFKRFSKSSSFLHRKQKGAGNMSTASVSTVYLPDTEDTSMKGAASNISVESDDSDIPPPRPPLPRSYSLPENAFNK